MLNRGKFVITIYQNQQCRCYGKVQLSPKLLMRIRKAQKPTVSSFDDKHLSIDELERNDTLKIQRRIWARRGNKSGIEINEIVPTREEIFKEAKRENEWWPSLQHLQSEVQALKQLKEEYNTEQMRKIKKNMAMMPKWIQEYKENLRKEEEEAIEQKQAQQRELEKIQEHFGYNIDRKHPKLVEHKENLLLEKKEAAKKAKKEKMKQQKLLRAKSTTAVF